MTGITIPYVGKQRFFAEFLNEARNNVLHDALASACVGIDPKILRDGMGDYVSAAGLRALQGSGIRDEEVFVIPAILERKPSVLGYYRLLLGISQKQFYTKETGLAPFKSMEDKDFIPPSAQTLVPSLCKALNEAMSELIASIPTITLKYNVQCLPIMSLGAQADGSWRNNIGANATQAVFDALKEIVKETNRGYEEKPNSITVTNDSGRNVVLRLSPDPDVVILEYFGDEPTYKTAIEIKGGKDHANVHNRAGEAEKSHQKAHQDGAQDCWTVIHLQGVDIEKLRQESPSTRQWFDLSSITSHQGKSWDTMKRLVRSAMGI